VTVSSWLTDLRDQIQHTRFLNLVNRSVAFMRSHVPFVSHPHSKVVDADMLVKSNEVFSLYLCIYIYIYIIFDCKNIIIIVLFVLYW
jgi:hypothetical protein